MAATNIKFLKFIKFDKRALIINFIGGYFKARLSFPVDYPMKPPKMKFVSKIWHPNVHDNGEVSTSVYQNLD